MRYTWISIKYIRLRDIILSIRYPLIEYLIKMFRMKVPQSKRVKRNVSISENFSLVSFSAEYYLRPQLASLTIDKRGLWNWGVARQPCSFSDQQIQKQIQTNTITTIYTNITAGTKKYKCKIKILGGWMDLLWLKFLDSFQTEVNEDQNILEFMCFVSKHRVFHQNNSLCWRLL